MLQLLRRLPQLPGHGARHVLRGGGRRNLVARAEGGPRVPRRTLRPNRRYWRSGHHLSQDNSQLPHIRPCTMILVKDLVKKTYQPNNPRHRCPCRSRQRAPPPCPYAPAKAAFAPSRARLRVACPRQKQQPSHLPKPCWARGRPVSQPTLLCYCPERQTSRLSRLLRLTKGIPDPNDRPTFLHSFLTVLLHHCRYNSSNIPSVRKNLQVTSCRCFGSDHTPGVAPQGVFRSRTVSTTVAKMVRVDRTRNNGQDLQVRAA
jgi:hypothetical protein